MEISNLLGITRADLEAKEGKLPTPHKHGEATTRWLNSEVREYDKLYFLKGQNRE